MLLRNVNSSENFDFQNKNQHNWCILVSSNGGGGFISTRNLLPAGNNPICEKMLKNVQYSGCYIFSELEFNQKDSN